MWQKNCFLSSVLILKFGTPNFTDPGLLNMTKDPVDPHWFVVVVLPSRASVFDLLTELPITVSLSAGKGVAMQGSLFPFRWCYLIILIKPVVIAVINSLISWLIICFQDCSIVFLIFGQFQMDLYIYS